MEIADVAGLLIFMGTFMTLSVFVCAQMERRLRRVDRVIEQIEEDAKYVN